MIAVFADADVIIQVGPGVHLATVIKEYYPGKAIFAINSTADIKTLKKFVTTFVIP